MMEGKLYEDIYACLTSHFAVEEEIPAEIVIKQMLVSGFLPHKYGYTNMREMFGDLSQMLQLKTGADGRMCIVIHASDVVPEEEFTAPRSHYGDIGLFAGKTLDEEEKPIKPNRVNAESDEPDTLPAAVKKQIYLSVVRGLQLEKPLYMSTLSPVLRYAGVEHDKLGFIKTKNMLKRCSDFMELDEIMMNGVPQTLVTVHHVPEWDEEFKDITAENRITVLDDAEKNRIYETLCEHMTFGDAIHMAAFCPILRTYGFDYKKYGYQKVKDLAFDLSDFLYLEEVVMNGVPQTLVTLCKKDGKEKSPEEEAAEEFHNEQPLREIAFLPPKTLSVLSRMTGEPVWACEDALEEAFAEARQSGKLIIQSKFLTRKGVLSENKELTMRFPLSLQTMRGDVLMAELHESGNPDGKQWFLAWIGSPDGGKTAESKTEYSAADSRKLTPILTECAALSESVVRAAAFKSIGSTELRARTLITEDYKTAYAENRVMPLENGEYRYALSQKSADGRTIYVVLSENQIGDKSYYVRFVGVDATEEKPVEKSSYAEKKDTSVLPERLQDLAYLPPHIVSLLAYQCGVVREEAQQILENSYLAQKDAGKVVVLQNSLQFPLLQTNLAGELLTAHLRPSENGRQDWFLQYVDATSAVKSVQSVELSKFEQFAFIGDWSAFLQSIAENAMPEDWDFAEGSGNQLLKHYLCNAFERVVQQNRIVYNAERSAAAINTGLTNRFGTDIIMTFTQNLPGSKLPWRFVRLVNGRVGNEFYGQPFAPTYFDSRNQPWFDTERPVLAIEDEIVVAGLRKLPKEFLKNGCNAMEISLIEQMIAHPERENGVYRRLTESFTRNPSQLAAMQESIGKYVSYAVRKVKRDYAYAVPGYHAGQFVWMLPIQVKSSDAPDVILAVSPEYDCYRPTALLNRKEAFLAARMIHKMDGGWLKGNAKEIE